MRKKRRLVLTLTAVAFAAILSAAWDLAPGSGSESSGDQVIQRANRSRTLEDSLQRIGERRLETETLYVHIIEND